MLWKIKKKKKSRALALFVIHGHNHLIFEGTSLSTHYLAGVFNGTNKLGTEQFHKWTLDTYITCMYDVIVELPS